MAKKKDSKSVYDNLQDQITSLKTALNDQSSKLSKKARKEYKVQLKALKKQAKPLQQAYEEVQIQQAGFTAAYDALAAKLFGSEDKKSKKKKNKKKSSKKKDTKLIVKAPTKNKAAAKDAKAAGIKAKVDKPRKPGRPTGSKNKKTSSVNTVSTTGTVQAPATTTGTRGRTPAGTNKAKASTATGAATGTSSKRGSGPRSGLTKSGVPRKKPGPKPKGDRLPKGKKADGSDDLTVISGIGASVERKLIEGGIASFRELGKASVTRLKTLISSSGPRYRNYDPTPWREQAKLANAGKWDELKK